MTTRPRAVPGPNVAGRITVVGVSKLRVGREVGNGVRVAAGELVGVAVPVGVADPVNAGVQVIRTTLSAPWNVGVAEGDCPDRARMADKPLHIPMKNSNPTAPIANFPPGLCCENQSEISIMSFIPSPLSQPDALHTEDFSLAEAYVKVYCAGLSIPETLSQAFRQLS